MERSPPEKESNIGVFAVVIQMISPQKFMLENLTKAF